MPPGENDGEQMTIDPKLIGGVLAKAKIVLTDWQFEVFEAHFGRDASPQEIADEYGRSVSSIYKVINRANRRMQKNWRS